MKWWQQLGKDKRGSRPRCVLIMDGDQVEIAERLTRLINLPDVVVSLHDKWMPYGKPVQIDGSWDKAPAKEARLDQHLTPFELRKPLRKWWLEHPNLRGETPNWDIATTCCIADKPGLLLVEAKAHEKELSPSGKSAPGSPNSHDNHRRIASAIAEAREALEAATGNPWGLSRDTHYQLSNRFAWSWKLASLRIPVVLLYLGFLSAEDMTDDGPLFRSLAEMEAVTKRHCRGIIDETCWGNRLDIEGTPLIPLIRVVDQPFDPDC